jgi:hypothetical protein
VADRIPIRPLAVAATDHARRALELTAGIGRRESASLDEKVYHIRAGRMISPAGLYCCTWAAR